MELKETKFIHQFIKDPKTKQLVGCVVAVAAGKVGWSKCRTTVGCKFDDSGTPIKVTPDVFNKERALKIAVGRASINPVVDVSEVPSLLKDTVKYFKDNRSVRYFKSTL